MKKIVWLVVIAAAVFGIWTLMNKPVQAPGMDASGSGDISGSDATDATHQSSGDDMTPPGTTVTAGADVTLGAVKNITVTGSNFKFAPSTITVKKGDKVHLTFVNSGGLHDFRIDELGVATKKVNGGEQDVVDFVASKAGTFEFYCSVGTHRQMGMKGTITVTE